MNLKNQKVFFLLAFFLIFISIPQSVFADFKLIDAIQEFGEKRFVKTKPSRLRFGPVRVHPTIRSKATWDQNILLEDRDAREDVVFNIQPGAIIEIPVRTHQIAVGYEADMEIFSKSRHGNQTDQNQNMFALIDLKFPSWYVNVLDQLSETSGRAGTTFTGRVPRIDHSIYPKIGIRWNRFILEEGFRHFTRDFRRQVDDSLDFQLTEWTTVLFYDLFARLKALVDFQVSQIDYDDDFERNGTFFQTRFGFEGELIPNLVLKTRTGMQFRGYEEASEPDFNSWVMSFNLDYKFRRNLTFKFSGERVPVEATFADVNYFKRHILRVGFEYEIHPKWVHFQNAKFYRDDYAERATLSGRTGFRRDQHFSYEVGLKYIPTEWMEWELAYELFRRNSNFSTFDYTDHRISLTSVLSY